MSKFFFVIVDERDHEKFRIFRLGKLSYKGMKIWGFPSRTSIESWNQIRNGDVVFFAQKNSDVDCYGVVIKKTINNKLSKLWGSDPRSKTVNHFLVFDALPKTSIRFHEILKWVRLKNIPDVFSGIYQIKNEYMQEASKYTREQKKLSRKNDTKSISIPVDYGGAPGRNTGTVTRFIRDTAKSKLLKKKYKDRCQVCNYRIQVSENTYYSEVHHIFPLKDSGPDNFNNMIVLCPTHHAEFDYKAIGIDEDGKTIIDRNGKKVGSLILQNDHNLDKDSIRFHLKSMINR